MVPKKNESIPTCVHVATGAGSYSLQPRLNSLEFHAFQVYQCWAFGKWRPKPGTNKTDLGLAILLNSPKNNSKDRTRVLKLCDFGCLTNLLKTKYSALYMDRVIGIILWICNPKSSSIVYLFMNLPAGPD